MSSPRARSLALLALTAGLTLAAGPSPAKPPSPAPSAQPQPGVAAPAAPTFQFKVMSLSGGPLSNADFKGKILIVDVWATWCGPCRMVIPHLISLREKYRSRGVEVVGLSVDDPAPDGKGFPHVTKFVAQYGIKYPIGLMNSDAYHQLVSLMGASARSGFSIPTTVVMARDSHLLKIYPGYFNGQEQELERVIEKALAAETQPRPKP